MKGSWVITADVTLACESSVRFSRGLPPNVRHAVKSDLGLPRRDGPTLEPGGRRRPLRCCPFRSRSSCCGLSAGLYGCGSEFAAARWSGGLHGEICAKGNGWDLDSTSFSAPVTRRAPPLTAFCRPRTYVSPVLRRTVVVAQNELRSSKGRWQF